MTAATIPLDRLSFHHLGVACGDLATEMTRFENLGYRQEGDAFVDPIQKVRGVFLAGPGPRLELLAPLDPSSPITSWIAKGIRYYHQAFEVPSIGQALIQLRAQNGRVVSAPEPGIAFGDRPIAFVMLPGMILIEVIQAA